MVPYNHTNDLLIIMPLCCRRKFNISEIKEISQNLIYNKYQNHGLKLRLIISHIHDFDITHNMVSGYKINLSIMWNTLHTNYYCDLKIQKISKSGSDPGVGFIPSAPWGKYHLCPSLTKIKSTLKICSDSYV